MALDEANRGSDELDRILEDEIDGYEAPTDEELSDFHEAAPHPSDAADYGSESDGRVDD